MAEPVSEDLRQWSKVIVPRRGLLEIPWRELWSYRDLIAQLARRDIQATYKQTIFGPLWFILQPLLTTAAFSVIFGRMAKMGTEHIPHFLFYMSGLIAWQYFADGVNKISLTFTKNAAVFGKVYFPRLAVPISILCTNALTFCVQLTIFLAGLAFYLVQSAPIDPNWRIAALPLVLVQIAMLALGVGCIIASLTAKYRDLSLGVGFGVQLWMYASAIVFPLSRIDAADRWIFQLNPMVPAIEAFRFAFLGSGIVSKVSLLYAFGVSAVVLLIGVMMFNRVDQTVMDTV